MDSNHLPVTGGVAVVIAVIVSFFVINPTDLEGFRPGGDSRQIAQIHGLEDVQARLWQDPFAAASVHLNRQQSPPIQLSGQIVLPASGDKQSRFADIRLGQSAISKAQPSYESERHSLARLQREIGKEAVEEAGSKKAASQNDGGITVLAVMVSASPYAKQAETRKRMRYAALSALGAEQFYPKDAEYIGVVNDLNQHKVNDSARQQLSGKVCSKQNRNTEGCKGWLDLSAGAEQLPLMMPYEWFEKKSEGKEKHVLLLWLDEDAFGVKPLTKLDVIFGLLGEDVAQIKLIGPYGSGTLKRMVGEASRDHEDWQVLRERVEVYSATATGSDQVLTGGGLSVESRLAGIFRRFQRTISIDDILMADIVDELQKRLQPSEAKSMDFNVAILSEWDTAYGRALPEAFAEKACIKNSSDGKCSEQAVESYKREHLHMFRYMRGIDGLLAEDSQDAQRTSNDSNASADKKVKIERPEGRSQKDYLRRLADQISTMKRELKSDSKKSILAVGVLGSDVYDKLLILKALRNRLPEAIFFTTDLDASLLHPENYSWTRNLIIASAFG
ncbi:MAG: hypothetical protein R8K50_06295, partial [Mariprofundus sp.]